MQRGGADAGGWVRSSEGGGAPRSLRPPAALALPALRLSLLSILFLGWACLGAVAQSTAVQPVMAVPASPAPVLAMPPLPDGSQCPVSVSAPPPLCAVLSPAASTFSYPLSSNGLPATFRWFLRPTRGRVPTPVRCPSLLAPSRWSRAPTRTCVCA